GFSTTSLKAPAQVEELQQLVLNIQKLAQLRQILVNLKEAYQILQGGYNTIINISQGNFSLHKTFLDGLMAVSPSVRNYKKIGDIISMQVQLVKEYKNSLSRLRSSAWFTPEELDYISNVYAKLFDNSLDDLDVLISVTTANKLRMSDDERIKEIDRLYTTMQQKLVFLRQFNGGAAVLGVQRSKEQNEVDVFRKLYDISK
ncbi:MAG TPA: TerB family tellurite resistance protein, partial [Agriterribacter sp.]|nr:TerB family tellurite resistance protein [Agriterribacter sp.]